MSHTEIEITVELVRDLLRDQHPDLADRPVRLGARGWDNQLWRLGDDLAVRLPWATQDADALLRKEHAWVPALAPHLPLQVPVPQRLGEPSERFPRPWIVTTWVPGTPADHAPATRAAEAADALAAFLTALHRPAPDAAPAGRGSGGPLADRAEQFAEHLAPPPEQVRCPHRDLWVDRELVQLAPTAQQPRLPRSRRLRGRPGGLTTTALVSVTAEQAQAPEACGASGLLLRGRPGHRELQRVARPGEQPGDRCHRRASLARAGW